MKHWLVIMVLFPLAVSGSTITQIAGDKQDTIALDKSLSIFAEFSYNQSATKTEIILTIHGRVDEGVHLYSIHPQGDFAPDPTQLILESKILNLTGALQESKPQMIIDDAFRLPLKVHKNEFWLRQKCSITKGVKQGLHNIRGYIEYQVCNNRICSLPLRKHFQEKVQID